MAPGAADPDDRLGGRRLGLVAWRQAPTSLTGRLLTLVAAAWFVANAQEVQLEPIASAATVLEWLYVGIVSHAILSYPDGRLMDRRLIVLVLAMYVAALAP